MQITVLSVSKTQHMTKANKPYFQLEVAYKGEDGQVKGKKLMPFGSSKPAFDAIQSAQSGEAWNITLVKEGEYWSWTAASKSDGSTPQQAQQGGSSVPTQSNTFKPKNNDEVQRYIIRQSSVASAVNLLKDKTKVTTEEVITAAKAFEAYVLDKEECPAVAAVKVGLSDDNFENDVPL